MMNWVYIFFFVVSFGVNDRNKIPAETKATVYIFLSEDCPICRYYIPEINQLYETYSETVEFVGVFPNFSSKPEKIKTFKHEYKLMLPTQTDYFKKLSHALGAKKTPEVFVTNQEGEIVYKGRIDNSFVALGKRRRVVTSRDLDSFLSQLLTMKHVPFLETEAVGCYINFADLN